MPNEKHTEPRPIDASLLTRQFLHAGHTKTAVCLREEKTGLKRAFVRAVLRLRGDQCPWAVWANPKIHNPKYNRPLWPDHDWARAVKGPQNKSRRKSISSISVELSYRHPFQARTMA